METENRPKHIKCILQIPLWTFSISFGLGTYILLLFLTDKDNSDTIIMGFFYVFAATVINFGLLLFSIVSAIVHKEYRKQILKRTAVMLINIPIAILYFYIVTKFN